MKNFLLAAAVLFCGAPVAAQERLEPEHSAFAGNAFMQSYEAQVLKTLGSAYDGDVRVRMIGIPSFFPEFAVGISEKAGAYNVFHLQPEAAIWDFQTLNMMKRGEIRRVDKPDAIQDDIEKLQTKLPPSVNDGKIERCDVPIEAPLALRIIAVWKKMLMQTGFIDPPPMGSDGAAYHFSMRDHYLFLAGQTWSPQSPGRARMLLDVTRAMDALCSEPGGKNLADLQQRTATLEQALQ